MLSGSAGQLRGFRVDPKLTPACGPGTKTDPDMFFLEGMADRATHICLAHCPVQVRRACYRHAENTQRAVGFPADTVQAGMLWPADGQQDQRPRDVNPDSGSCYDCNPALGEAIDEGALPRHWPYRRCRVCNARVRVNPDTLLVAPHVDGLKACLGSSQPPTRLAGLEQTVCRNGHALTPDNVRTRRTGQRLCLTCRREQQTARRREAGAPAARSATSEHCVRGHRRNPKRSDCGVCRAVARRQLGRTWEETALELAASGKLGEIIEKWESSID